MMHRSLQYLFERFLLRRSALIARATRFDMRFNVMAGDAVGRTIYKHGVYERVLTDYVIDNVSFANDDLIIDVGANLGWYALLFGVLSAGKADVYAFEPEPNNFELLTKNIQLNGSRNVHAVQKALSDHCGPVTLYRHNANNLGRHSLIPMNEGDVIDVESTTIDHFVASNRLEQRPVKLLKIDVEGLEISVLRGAAETLSRTETIILEYSPELMVASGVDPADLVDCLVGHGFVPQLAVNGVLVAMDVDYLKQKTSQHNLVWTRP